MTAAENSSSTMYSGASTALDPSAVRADFPIFDLSSGEKPLIYLDSGASSQKPRVVIDALADLYANRYASVHRGVYRLSEQLTHDFEAVREKVRAFIGAPNNQEIVFTRNTTEAINLVAASWGRTQLSSGDEILISHMEHHSNIVPWQLLCAQTGAILKVAPITDRGELDMDEFERHISPRTKLISIVHVSNALGTVNPAREICSLAQSRGIPVLLDGAQAAPHMTVDVQELGCDFYVFSGHKTFGPTGTGVLWAKQEILEAMPPYQGGGSMIASVHFDKTTYAPPPQRFEAGTPDIAGVIGLGVALDWMSGVGVERIAAWEHELLTYATAQLEAIPGLRLIGTAPAKASVLSFVLDCAHPHDIATIFDQQGVAIRAGHHCAQPVMERFGVSSTARASLAVYNTLSDIDALVLAIEKTQEIFS